MELIKTIELAFKQGKQKRNDMIQKALNQSYNMLDIKQFIEVTDFKLNDILPFDLMWNSFEQDIPIYVTDDFIKIFGYKGELKTQKMAMMKLIKKYNIPIIQLKNDEYKEFLNKNNLHRYYPKITNKQLKSKPLHTLIFMNDFKSILLSVNTIKGEYIRKYYIEIENLFYLYLFYQCSFYKRSFYKEILEIRSINKEYNRQIRLQILDKELYDRYKIGVVYFICEKDNKNIVKIGYTFNLPERLNNLQCANYKELIVKKYYFTQFPQIEERRLHSLYREKHIRGEWYMF